jgi:hypothetical protein
LTVRLLCTLFNLSNKVYHIQFHMLALKNNHACELQYYNILIGLKKSWICTQNISCTKYTKVAIHKYKFRIPEVEKVSDPSQKFFWVESFPENISTFLLYLHCTTNTSSRV